MPHDRSPEAHEASVARARRIYRLSEVALLSGVVVGLTILFFQCIEPAWLAAIAEQGGDADALRSELSWIRIWFSALLVGQAALVLRKATEYPD